MQFSGTLFSLPLGAACTLIWPDYGGSLCERRKQVDACILPLSLEPTDNASKRLMAEGLTVAVKTNTKIYPL
jgi:hypothetical protein